jgi:hypothetical protein
MSWKINELQQGVPLVAPPGVRFPLYSVVLVYSGFIFKHPIVQT